MLHIYFNILFDFRNKTVLKETNRKTCTYESFGFANKNYCNIIKITNFTVSNLFIIRRTFLYII